MNKKLFEHLFILTTLVIVLIFVFSEIPNFSSQKISSRVPELEELSISAGVVPHHLLAQEIIHKFFKELSNRSSIETVILFSPDHYNQTALTGGRFITVSPIVKEGKQKEDSISDIVHAISQNQLVKVSDFSVGHDQGATNLMPFFEEYLPNTSVVPILVSSVATVEEIKELVDQLNEIVSRNTVFVASVDFGHYLPDSVLLLHDVKSIRALINLEEGEFLDLDVDSWQSLYGVRYFAKLRNMETGNITAVYSYSGGYNDGPGGSLTDR